jgi:hypothetical protein
MIAVCRIEAKKMNWSEVTGHAWSFLYLQIARSFILPQIDVPSFRSLPGSDPARLPPPQLLTGSNVYSTPESILLSWLEIHMRKMLPQAAHRLFTFDIDLADGVALCCTIASHWPPLSRFMGQVIEAPGSHADNEANAKVLLGMLDALQCPFKIKEEQVASATRLDMLFFVAFLYSWLPQLIPRGTVSFSGKLQEDQIREIELDNPTQKVLSYSVKLHGHEDFTMEAQSVRIEPKSKACVAVKCKPTSGMPQTSHLVLSTRRDGDALGAMLVFKLVSEVCNVLR